ncbi:MAG TPA: A/G-specific adenine glycosylase [Kofleriaceae bacterium]
MKDSSLGAAVVAHYATVKRDLPWRRSSDPYAIWVSEIMLQQTRVQTVIPYWQRWMAKFPTVRALADAPLDDVLAAWAGLGYYSRARNLKKGAEAITAKWDGKLPQRASELREVPGIGPYTAGAIASIAFGERAPLVDGNVARVLARVAGIEHDIKSTAGQRALWERAGALVAALPEGAAPGDLNQGLMELGATLCTPTSPRCLLCPLATACIANRTGRQAELPRAARRKKLHELRVLARDALWMCDGDAIVLGRRAPDGLFGGLWELPQGDAALDVARALGVTVEHSPVAYHDQTLTHRRLRIRVLVAAMPASLVDASLSGYDAFARVPLASVSKLGIAAATAAILKKYEDIPWPSTSTPKRLPSSRRATTRSSKASRASATRPETTTSKARRRVRPKASTSSSTIKNK